MKHLIFAAIALFFLQACSTITRGTNADMVVDTVPTGARVTTDLPAKGKRLAGRGCDFTPCEFEVPRKADFLMTISKEGYEPVDIGVISRKSKESLNANLKGSGVAGLAIGTYMGVAISGATVLPGAIITSGEAALIGATAATGVAVIAGATSLGVDAATGANLNPNPSPVFVELPPAGMDIPEHPTVERLRIWRMTGPEGRAARKAYKADEKAARKEAKRQAKAAKRAAKAAGD